MTLDKETLKAAVKEVWIRSLTQLQPDVEEALVQACDKETNERAKKYLGIMLDNARIAKKTVLLSVRIQGFLLFISVLL